MERSEFDKACEERRDDWLPANGGTETPATYRNGRRLLYVFNPKLGRHAYLDCQTDTVLSDEESWYIIGG